MKRLTALALGVLLLFTACGQRAVPEVSTTASQQGTVYPPLLDYSHHTHEGEAHYRTVLADLEALGRGERAFAMEEAPANWQWEYTGIEDSIWGHDFRSRNVAHINLSELDWNYFSFDSNTIWPDNLPQGFDPAGILEYGKNPGLGIRALHDRGIDGTGVGIAIIDQPLLLSHREYADNLMSYERIHCPGDTAAMHGPAVASIAVGKTVGTAPGSKLYYVANTFGHYEAGGSKLDFTLMADCVYRVLEINETLPESEKIRVISISRGYDPSDPGYKELDKAIAEANARNIFVLTTSPWEYYTGFRVMGMERDYWSDPDGLEGWLPAGWLTDFYMINEAYSDWLWVPMGSRSYASCTGDSNYELNRQGGLSWAVPWLAGFYALCCQVEPDITPEIFIGLCKETAVSVPIEHDGRQYFMKMVINPPGVIEALEE